MNLRMFATSAVFHALQLVLLPLAVFGNGLMAVRLFRYSRESSASVTVLASFYTRWMQHQLGTRCDEPCARLMRVLPTISPLGLRLVTAPTLVAHALTGYVPWIYRYPYAGAPPMKDQPAARTTFFDLALQCRLTEIDQLVVLGAGLDTRAYRLPPDARVRCFEVDTPRTQPFKRQMLKKAGVDTSQVTYVSADFRHEDWLEKLIQAGFDPRQRTLFLWESVTMYLDRPAVETTLRMIAGTARGSRVAFDYLSSQLIDGTSLYMRYTRATLSAVGEPWHFGIDSTPPVRPRVAAFVAACGLTLEEQRNFGQETDRKYAEAGFAVASV
jgi:methyltransferase (TIGR00027 family)